MKVYAMAHKESGTQYWARCIDDVMLEAEDELKECGFTMDEIGDFRKALESLEPTKEGYAGEIVVFGPFIVSAEEMYEREYEALPEWDGW